MQYLFNRTIFRLFMAGLLLLVGSTLPMAAQDDTFNPTNPPEPAVLYNVKVNSTPEDIAYLSGAGQYTVGQSVWINASARSSVYQFKHWLKNGETFDGNTSQSFYHAVDEEHVVYTAVFEYKPASPSEPSLNLKHRLYLEASPEGACSFNRTSGEKHLDDSYIYIETYPNQSYIFQGWYENGVLLSKNTSINYQMPAADATLMAKYIYSPANPGEPGGTGQGNIDTGREGDVNGDKVVDVSDAVAVLNIYLGKTSTVDPLKADVNGDGTADVTDAVRILNLYLNK